MLTRLALFASAVAVTSAMIPVADQQIIVNLHNMVRSQVQPLATNMNRMVWDEALALSSQVYADTCPVGHSLAPGVGENLSWGWPTMTPAEAVQEWINEKKDFSWAANECLPNTVCGHLTQMIWADTIKVGCGVKSCLGIMGHKMVDAWVCRYSTAGNYVGEFPYQTGSQSCSNCTIGTVCVDNLCTAVSASAIQGASSAAQAVPASAAGSIPLSNKNAASSASSTLLSTPDKLTNIYVAPMDNAATSNSVTNIAINGPLIEPNGALVQANGDVMQANRTLVEANGTSAVVKESLGLPNTEVIDLSKAKVIVGAPKLK